MSLISVSLADFVDLIPALEARLVMVLSLFLNVWPAAVDILTAFLGVFFDFGCFLAVFEGELSTILVLLAGGVMVLLF